jgi:pyrimidine deaminase RibD-like protein
MRVNAMDACNGPLNSNRSFAVEDHCEFMRRALEVAESCHDIVWYGVGCIIVNSKKEIISTGYTNELSDREGKGRHAEDSAIQKAAKAGKDLKGTVIYSTLEPCSVRASGKTPCVQRILDAGIAMVVYGAREPYDPKLGVVCEGHEKLEKAGIQVVELREMAVECAASVVSKRKNRP